jgi:diguanylate cyclase (GGDEF)-like protein
VSVPPEFDAEPVHAPVSARRAAGFVGRLVALLCAAGWASQLVAASAGWGPWQAALLDPLVAMAIAGPAVWVFVAVPVRRLLATAELKRRERERRLHEVSARQQFDGTLRRAFELAQDETAALDVVTRAGELVAPGTSLELLLADSSQAHLRRAACTVGHDDAGCRVTEPYGCPSMAAGRTRVFRNSVDLDACPQLRGRPSGDVSALCVPVTFLGRALGVLHMTGRPDQPASEETVQRMRLLGGQTGATLGMLRAMARSQVQASTDSLTGLMNRRSLLDRVRTIDRSATRYAVLMADLDEFKKLNDVHGHDTGDRALRLFSKVLKESVRDGDLVGRYGGEEFLLVLPGQDVVSGTVVAERIRSALDVAARTGGTPVFTTSIGVADSSQDLSFEDVVRSADAALFDAKHLGRDRVCSTATAIASLPSQRQADEELQSGDVRA